MMRITVIGATGNVGTSLLRALAGDARVESIVGVARRTPSLALDKTTWHEADVARDDVTGVMRGSDVLVHLAWLIQPSRDQEELRRVNVDGSRRVFRAVADASVPSLVYASSVGAYSPGPKDRSVDEGWPARGIDTSFYSRHKAEVESLLDDFEKAHPQTRVVRLRPGLIFKREAASEIRRLFIGPFLPNFLVRSAFVPAVPHSSQLRFQAVHSYDAAEAYRLAALGDARGAFNIAADPVIGPEELASVFGATRLPIPPRALRAAAAASWRLRLQPSPEGWVDMGSAAPIMDTSRARAELGWIPRFSSIEALTELVKGLRAGAGWPTPALEPDRGSLRLKELVTGLGRRGP
jgi:UDP-glucose 4-epimerase